MHMDPAPDSNSMTHAAPGYYAWRAPSGSMTVQLSLEVVERMLGDVLTGFGAVPRRGAEIGGILIGAIEGDTVTIDDFVVAPCEYRRGPSFLLSEADQAAFAQLFDQWKREPGRSKYAVGYFRSNTREQFGIGDEDRALMRQYFSGAANVMLIIRPYATKPSIAGFITWNEGELAGAPSSQFPFKRAALAGEPAPPRRPLASRRPRVEHPVTALEPSPLESEETIEMPVPRFLFSRPGERRAAVEAQPVETPPVETQPVETPPAEAPAAAPGAGRRTWLWVLIAVFSVLVGGILGFQAALTFFGRTPAPGADPYALSLAVSAERGDLHLTWDRRSAAIRSARQGALEIVDGDRPAMRRELDAGLLRSGSVIYHPISDRVQFRVEVFRDQSSSVAATVEWRR
jgi:hypothetical protein